MDDLSKYVTSTPSDPIREMPGTYKDDISHGSENELLQSGEMPKGKDPSPFKIGPMSSGSR